MTDCPGPESPTRTRPITVDQLLAELDKRSPRHGKAAK
jgi:hypothetical protein